MATSRRHLGSVQVFFLDSSVISGWWRTAARWKTRYSVWLNVPRRDGCAPGDCPRPTLFPGARAPAPYSPADRAELAALAAAQRDAARRSSALALVVFGIGAGLRPGELVALRGDDVTRHGRQVVVHAGGPIRVHIEVFGVGPEGRIFRSENGNPIQPSTWWQVWRKVRALSLTPEQLDTPLLRRPYDLRHSGVTWRLNSGVPPTEVAAWAGHSVDVLMRVYAKCMTGLEDVRISRMDDTLHLEGAPRDVGPREDGPEYEDAQE